MSATEPEPALPACKRCWYHISLRMLWTALFVGGVLFAVVKWFGLFFFLRAFEHAVLDCPCGEIVVPAAFMLICGVIGWALARRFKFSLRVSVASVVVMALSMLAATTVSYLAYARYRVVFAPFSISPSASWPHPDRAITELYAYFEARNPIPRGLFSYHGKWPDVRFTLDAILFVVAGMMGACLGALFYWFPPKNRRRQTTEASDSGHRHAFRRYTRLGLGLAIAIAVGWLLLKMEQTRRQWEDEGKWAAAGAKAEYRDGKLIGLYFNILTLSMHYFGNERLGDADVSQFKELTDLEYLGLTDTQVTNLGLQNLAGLTELKWLDLDGTCITDAGLAHLTRFTDLERLSLGRTHITDAGMSTLVQLPNLQILVLDDTGITDVGLVHLARVRQLKCLDISKNHVSDKGVEKLQEALPNCTIYK